GGSFERASCGRHPKGRNKRTVWSIPTKPFKGAHFAVFPPDLIEPCILAGSPEKACPHCGAPWERRSEEHTSELQSREKFVCSLLLVKKINSRYIRRTTTITVIQHRANA